MHLQHIRYAVKVAEYRSISKAAEVLYISQPNLSRAIRELEQELGLTLFLRSNQGVTPTFAGEAFLVHARAIVEQVDEIYSLTKEKQTLFRFSLAVPRAGYISNAFTRFLGRLDGERKMLVDYKETSATGAIGNVLEEGFRLGIVRYQKSADAYYQSLFEKQGLKAHSICSFTYKAAMNRDHPLAQKQHLCYRDLMQLTEITHGDSYLLTSPIPEAEAARQTDRIIHVYDSMGQLAMLSRIPGTFMMVYPLEREFLDRYHLVQREVEDYAEPFCDLLIYKNTYRFTPLDQLFLQELQEIIAERE